MGATDGTKLDQTGFSQDIATLVYNRHSAFSKADDGVYTHPPLLNTARSGFTLGVSVLDEHNTYTRARGSLLLGLALHDKPTIGCGQSCATVQ